MGECLAGLGRSLSLIPTYLYIFWLGLSLPLKVTLTYSSSIALVLTAAWFSLEAITVFFHRKLINIHLPLWLQILVVGIAFFMSRHRLHEFKSLKRKPVFLTNLHLLIKEAATLNFQSVAEDERTQKLRDFIEKVLISFRTVFSDIGAVQLNVMLPNENGHLQIIQRFPETVQYDPHLTLKPEEGGAGVAFSSGNLVYIPRVRYRHGIMIGMPAPGNTSDPVTYKLKELVYIPTSSEPYRSILSAPIHSATGVVGVLNIDANTTNPFAESEFETAQVAASFIGMALDRYRISGN